VERAGAEVELDPEAGELVIELVEHPGGDIAEDLAEGRSSSPRGCCWRSTWVA
jgi:hypothetical protein